MLSILTTIAPVEPHLFALPFPGEDAQLTGAIHMKNMTSSLVSQKPEKVYAANDELIEEERWMAEHYGPLPFGTGDRVRFNVSAPEERLLELGLNAKGSMVVLRVVDDRDTLVCATNFPDSDRVSREVFFPDPVTVVVAHEASGKFLIISASYLQMAE